MGDGAEVAGWLLDLKTLSPKSPGGAVPARLPHLQIRFLLPHTESSGNDLQALGELCHNLPQCLFVNSYVNSTLLCTTLPLLSLSPISLPPVP